MIDVINNNNKTVKETPKAPFFMSNRDSSNLYLVVENNISGTYNFVNLENGRVLHYEYYSIEELLEHWGEMKILEVDIVVNKSLKIEE